MSEVKFVPDSSLSEPEFVVKYLTSDLSKSYLKARWRWMNNIGTWLEAHEEYIKTPIGIKTMEDRKLNGANHGRLFV